MTRSLRLGIFVVAALLIFGCGIFLIGDKRFLFTSTYRLNAAFQNAGGLNEGAPVRVTGIHEGTVHRILLPRQPGSQVVVVMNMRQATRGIIKKDSAAAIHSEGLVGDKYVEIAPGSKDAAGVREGDTLRGERPLQVSDLLKKANDILESAKGTVASADATVNHVKSISSKIDEGKGTVGALINDRAAFESIHSGAAAFQENMQALKHNFLLRGFFHRRGYEDSAELTRYAIARLPGGPAQRRFTYDAARLFHGQDSARLKNPKTLDEAGRFLEGAAFGLAVVACDAGLRGDAKKNRVLTDARAMVVREYLARNFKADDTRIRTMGLGEVSGSSGAGRVEIVVYPASKKAPVREARLPVRR